jgi:hypothetical protein
MSANYLKKLGVCPREGSEFSGRGPKIANVDSTYVVFYL